MTCEEAGILLNGLVDDQLGEDERTRLEVHLSTCARCRAELERLKRLEGLMKRVTLPRLPDEAWDEHWRHVYNRLERGTGYVLVGLGAILLLGWGGYELCKEWLRDPGIPLVVRLGCGLLAAGLIVLAVSTVREKILVSRYDRYKEIRR